MLHYDTRSYLSLLTELTDSDRTVSLTVFGSSMSPFLAGKRDTVLLQKPDAPPEKGDIILYRRASGQFVLHRVLRRREAICTVAGDAQLVTEEVHTEQIAAKVIKICRKGVWIDSKDRMWRFFATTWVTLFPIRRFLLFLCRIYGRIRGRFSR